MVIMVALNSLIHLFDQKRKYINTFFDQLNYDAVQQVFDSLYKCKGRILVTGVGKSGIIAQKIAATLLSTGVKAHYLSPVEAVHGDLGMILEGDVVLFLSKSGESDELLSLLPFVRNKGGTAIAVVCNIESRLAKASTLAIELPLEKELCPFGLAPTTSATLQLIFGDIMTVALMHERGFTVEEYATNHPAGSIGKRITIRVNDLMLKGETLPLCLEDQTLGQCLGEFSHKQCGALLVVDENKKLIGIFTDGDLRRALESKRMDLLETPMKELMTKTPRSIREGILAWDALRLMEDNQNRPITVLPVVDSSNQVVGLVKLHDILQFGLS